MHYYQADGDRQNVSLSSVRVNIGSRDYVKRIPSADNNRKTSRLSPICRPRFVPICPGTMGNESLSVERNVYRSWSSSEMHVRHSTRTAAPSSSCLPMHPRVCPQSVQVATSLTLLIAACSQLTCILKPPHCPVFLCI